jgi:hypothetical protein
MSTSSSGLAELVPRRSTDLHDSLDWDFPRSSGWPNRLAGFSWSRHSAPRVRGALGKKEPNIFTISFLDAVGRWQRGWKRDKAARLPIANALEREAATIPARFRQFSGELYRKRHLYKTEDMSELAPLFLTGILDEGSATSWSSDYSYIEQLGDETSFNQSNVASGAIFAHVPAPHEIVLNIPALWADPAFVAAANSYRENGGEEASGLHHFNVTQSEVVLRTPLRLSEVYALSLPGNFQSLATTMGFTYADEHILHQLLQTTGIDLSRPFIIKQAKAAPIIAKVVASITAKIRARQAVRTPHFGRLADAVALGDAVRAPSAAFLGWRRLSSRDGIMEGRWSDGTVAYQRRGKVWLY